METRNNFIDIGGLFTNIGKTADNKDATEGLRGIFIGTMPRYLSLTANLETTKYTLNTDNFTVGTAGNMIDAFLNFPTIMLAPAACDADESTPCASKVLDLFDCGVVVDFGHQTPYN